MSPAHPSQPPQTASPQEPMREEPVSEEPVGEDNVHHRDAVALAMELLAQGKTEQAAEHLHQAAAEAIALDRRDVAIRLLQLASATNRSAGQLPMARAQAEQAVQLVGHLQEQAADNTPLDAALAVMAWSEAAASAASLQMYDQALEEFSQALATEGLPDAARAVLLRQQATVLVALRRYQQARQALEQVLLEGELSPAQAAQVRVDVAALACTAEMPDRDVLVQRATKAAQPFPVEDDPHYQQLHTDLQALLRLHRATGPPARQGQ